MAHYQQLAFVKTVAQAFPEYFANKKVLEVGSWDVTGSIRSNFSDCDYTGADITKGPGIDLVCPGQDIDASSGAFDTVISCECFEHNKFWLETFINMIRMLRPGGLCVVSSAAPGRMEHGTNRRSAESSLTAVFAHSDYYRNLGISDFESRIELRNHFQSFGFAVPNYSNDLYFVGVKSEFFDAAVDERVRLALKDASQIGMAAGASPMALGKRLMLTHVGRNLERLMGSRLYQDVAYRLRR